MLVLELKLGDRVGIGDGITVKLLRLGQTRIRLGVVAPREIDVHREAVLKRIEQAAADGRLAELRRELDHEEDCPPPVDVPSCVPVEEAQLILASMVMPLREDFPPEIVRRWDLVEFAAAVWGEGGLLPMHVINEIGKGRFDGREKELAITVAGAIRGIAAVAFNLQEGHNRQAVAAMRTPGGN